MKATVTLCRDFTTDFTTILCDIPLIYNVRKCSICKLF